MSAKTLSMSGYDSVDSPTVDVKTPELCIEVQGLNKWYKRGKVKALVDVSLAVEKGEIFGLIGPNGAGKTTLMQCLIGIIRPTKGNIVIAGYPPDNLKVKEQLAFLPERPQFDGWMTARQFLRYHHMLAKKPFRESKQAVEDALDLVQLETSARDRKITQFSRGMLQRVGLAQMLVGDPKICFLDEPTAGMDPIGMQLVRDLLIHWKKRGSTVIINSHHLDEVERTCDRVAFIAAGSIQTIDHISDHKTEDLRLLIKWIVNDQCTKERVESIAEALHVVLESFDGDSARFRLTEREQKPLLIRALLAEDILVEEVTSERKALVELFIERAQASKKEETK